MSKAVILFADNDPDFLETRTEFLQQQGYQVMPTTDADEARELLRQGKMDLAVLDIRLRDDDDERDTSGLTLAKEEARTTPKIILTNFPSVDAVREALRPQLDGLPAAVEFVSKKEGPQALVQAINRSLGLYARWLQEVMEAIDGTDAELSEDYNNAQKQANANYWASLGVAAAGIVIIFLGVALVFWKQLEIGTATTVGGLVTEAVSVMFFRRVDTANVRMDRYHSKRIEGQQFKTLLQSCDGLDSDQRRERCRERIIMAATDRWLVVSRDDQDTAPHPKN
jgi:CheY-like chemotaxis protein